MPEECLNLDILKATAILQSQLKQKLCQNCQTRCKQLQSTVVAIIPNRSLPITNSLDIFHCACHRHQVTLRHRRLPLSLETAINRSLCRILRWFESLNQQSGHELQLDSTYLRILPHVRELMMPLDSITVFNYFWELIKVIMTKFTELIYRNVFSPHCNFWCGGCWFCSEWK